MLQWPMQIRAALIDMRSVGEKEERLYSKHTDTVHKANNIS